jgi:hypothetical protein
VRRQSEAAMALWIERYFTKRNPKRCRAALATALHIRADAIAIGQPNLGHRKELLKILFSAALLCF